MEQTQTAKHEANNERRSLAIRAIGVLFALSGIWGVVSTFMRWSIPGPSVSFNFLGFSFDIIGLVAIVAGFKLFRMQEDGRILAILLTWVNLASLMFTGGVALTQHSYRYTFKFFSFQLSPESPFMFFLPIAGFLVLDIAFIVIFSSQAVKELFEKNPA